MAELRSTMKGFTLVELMITLAIAAILASLAAPSFTDLIKNNRMTTQINELLSSFSLARSEAIKRGLHVSICKSSDHTSCTGDWHDGWIVFVDNNGTVGVVDPSDEILRVRSALSSNNTLTFNNGNYISYSPDGLVNIAGTFTLCDDRTDPEKYAKALIINNTGRPRMGIDADGDGIVEGGNNNVSCP